MNNSQHLRLIVSPAKALVLLLCLFIIGYLATAAIGLLLYTLRGQTTAILRIMAVLQDVIMLMMPAVVTAVLVTRQPADLLSLRGRLSATNTILAILTLCASIPAMNCLIVWNQSWHLPESMNAIEQAMRSLEETAASSVAALQGGNSVADLVMSILIVGICAGLAEELLFRGALLRLLSAAGLKTHATVWITAFIFSAIHFQIFGLVPRMILGAFFGYLLVWTRCLWVPVIAHAFNNIAYVTARWLTLGSAEDPTSTETPIDNLGTGAQWPVAIISVVATALILWLLWRRRVSRISCDGK